MALLAATLKLIFVLTPIGFGLILAGVVITGMIQAAVTLTVVVPDAVQVPFATVTDKVYVFGVAGAV